MNRHFLQDPLEYVPDAVLVIELSGLIVFANRRVEGLFGYRRTELSGHALSSLLSERSRTWLQTISNTTPTPRSNLPVAPILMSSPAVATGANSPRRSASIGPTTKIASWCWQSFEMCRIASAPSL